MTDEEYNEWLISKIGRDKKELVALIQFMESLNCCKPECEHVYHELYEKMGIRKKNAS